MFIKKNPLAMVGNISRCWLFVYKTPANDVRHLLPSQLELVEHHGRAFWNVVVCQVQDMRPKLSPFPIGVTYWHIAYRLYVRFKPYQKDAIEGLYFLRSDCDNSLMAVIGNVLTDFNFHTASIRVAQDSQFIKMKIAAPGGDAYATINVTKPPTLSAQSKFSSLDEASQFLKYKPNGISINSNGLANIVHIVRNEQNWRSKLVTVEEAKWSFFEDTDISLEICYEVEPIFYQWNRGQIYAAAERA
jgi:hypothetical protein